MTETHRPQVELEVAVGVGLRDVGPRLASVDAGGRTVDLLATHLWRQGGLEDVFAVHFLQLHVSPTTNKQTNEQ